MGSKPRWAISGAVWERAKTSVKRRHGIHSGGRFDELVQAEYLALGGQIHRPGFRKSKEEVMEDMPDVIISADGDISIKMPMEKAAQHFRSEAQRKYMWAKHPEIAEKWAHGEHSKPVTGEKKSGGGKPSTRGPGVHSASAGATIETKEGRKKLAKEKKKKKELDKQKAASFDFLIGPGVVLLKAKRGVETLEKGKAAEVGETRQRKGGAFKKVGPGKWAPVTEEKPAKGAPEAGKPGEKPEAPGEAGRSGLVSLVADIAKGIFDKLKTVFRGGSAVEEAVGEARTRAERGARVSKEEKPEQAPREGSEAGKAGAKPAPERVKEEATGGTQREKQERAQEKIQERERQLTKKKRRRSPYAEVAEGTRK